MNIDQWDLIKAILNGFANVFLNPRIMIPFIIFMFVMFFVKSGFRIIERKLRDYKSGNKISKSVMENCPQCGSHLVFRIARKGSNVGNSFYGCSSYPKCKYTKQI